MQTKEILIDSETKLKKCKTCGKLLSLDNYYKNLKARDKLFYSCKSCYSLYRKDLMKKFLSNEDNRLEHNRKNRLSYERNREKKALSVKKKRENNPEFFRNAWYKHKYGLDINDYNDLLEKQNNSCAICKYPHDNLNSYMAVDHDHTTGKVRGLLCRNCNLGLGNFRDSIEIIKNSITYLEKFK